MKLPAAVLSMVLAAAAPLMAGTRVAVVRVADVYKALETTRKEQDSIAADFAALTKDRRYTDLQKVRSDLIEQRATLPSKVDDTTRAKVRDFALRYKEAEAMQEDFASFYEQEAKKINTRKVKEMHLSLDQIVEAARKIGKAEGFDWVLDISGNSNTTIPVVVYSKAPVDLTERVLNVLQPPPAAPTPSATEPGKAPAADPKR